MFYQLRHRSSLVFSVLFLALVVSSIAVPELVLAKSTTDPNHKGWAGKYPKLKHVDWKPIQATCKQCSKMVDQYNQTIVQLILSRYWVKFWRGARSLREKGKADPLWPGKGNISKFEGDAIAANLELFELQSRQLTLHKQQVTQLEQQASYLRAAIGECERTACKGTKPKKSKAIRIGGMAPKGVYQPDTPSILKQHKINWAGPYASTCLPCQSIFSQLNAVPGWITRAHFKLINAQAQLKYAELINQSNKVSLSFLTYKHPDKTDYSGLQAQVDGLNSEIIGLAHYFKKLLKQLSECEKKYCPAKNNENAISLAEDELISTTPISTCPTPPAHEQILVGANNEVGSRANFKEKGKKKAIGMASKAITGLLGIGGSNSKSEGPATYKDPVKSKHKLKVKNKKAKRELRTGAVFTQDGLLVSNDIRKAPGNGTFQSVYLENQRGWRLQPIALYMYEIWKSWKLNVSWTRDTYINGEHVKHEEGGWTESWRELIQKGEETIYGEVQQAPLWQQLGFNTAVSGAKSLGSLFPVTPQMLANEAINLVVHVTDPKQDPVTTIPYVFRLSLGNKGQVLVEQVDNTTAAQGSPCVNATTRTLSSDTKPRQAPAADTEPSADTEPLVSKKPQTNDINREAPAKSLTLLNRAKVKDPCKDDCGKLRSQAESAAQAAVQTQSNADAVQQSVITAKDKADQAKQQADKAKELAKEPARNDRAIINGDKYTTADTEYRIKLQTGINAQHQDGKISNAEHEKQTKANTVKKAQQERLKNLARLKAEADKAQANADAEQAAAKQAQAEADKAQKLADDAQQKANLTKKAYDDCIKKTQEECEKLKAAEAKRIAQEEAEKERKLAEAIAQEKAKATAKVNKQERIDERKRLLDLIKELGLIDKSVSDVPSIWQSLPDILETPVAMVTELHAGVPISVDTIKAIGGLYGIAATMLNPCTKGGKDKTIKRLMKKVNNKTGRQYSFGEALTETDKMCEILKQVKDKISAAN
ncbi:MAG: hypothetical protein JKX81_05205 [Arenicella sp.]|nr:hypothetical protein [Arenicella sp.]